MATPTIAFVALGANLGDRLANLQGAVASLDAVAQVTVEALSKIYETAPVGGPDDQGAYYNAVVAVRTALAPLDLLGVLQEIEAAFLRARDIRWGPRTLDLDLLFYGDLMMTDPRLTLPHPRLHERRFVLAPLADVGAGHRHPATGKTVAEMLAALPQDDADDVTPVRHDWRQPL